MSEESGSLDFLLYGDTISVMKREPSLTLIMIRFLPWLAIQREIRDTIYLPEFIEQVKLELPFVSRRVYDIVCPLCLLNIITKIKKRKGEYRCNWNQELIIPESIEQLKEYSGKRSRYLIFCYQLLEILRTYPRQELDIDTIIAHLFRRYDRIAKNEKEKERYRENTRRRLYDALRVYKHIGLFYLTRLSNCVPENGPRIVGYWGVDNVYVTLEEIRNEALCIPRIPTPVMPSPPLLPSNPLGTFCPLQTDIVEDCPDDSLLPRTFSYSPIFHSSQDGCLL